MSQLSRYPCYMGTGITWAILRYWCNFLTKTEGVREHFIVFVCNVTCMRLYTSRCVECVWFVHLGVSGQMNSRFGLKVWINCQLYPNNAYHGKTSLLTRSRIWTVLHVVDAASICSFLMLNLGHAGRQQMHNGYVFDTDTCIRIHGIEAWQGKKWGQIWL